jgi:hypothetical protein
MNIAQPRAQAHKHRCFAAVMAAALLLSALGGCVVRPIGYWGPDHPRYYFDRY